MATYSAQIASGGTSGRQILVAATATPGTLVHTAHATDLDEIYLWATNNDTVARELTIELGGVTSPNDLVRKTIQPKAGLEQIVAGVRLTGSVVVRAFCATANVVSVAININRITA